MKHSTVLDEKRALTLLNQDEDIFRKIIEEAKYVMKHKQTDRLQPLVEALEKLIVERNK